MAAPPRAGDEPAGTSQIAPWDHFGSDNRMDDTILGGEVRACL